MRSSTRPRAARQRGVAALAVTVLVFFVMVLGVAYVNRNLVFEHRAAVNQYRATQAFEAAEAGLEWALALLDDPRPLGSDCLPAGDPAATSFRERHLVYDTASAVFIPATWLDGAVVTPLTAACVRGEAGWQCSCPSSAQPTLADPPGVVPAPAFTIRFEGVGRSALVRAVATGCTRLAGPCANGAGAAEATARVEALSPSCPRCGATRRRPSRHAAASTPTPRHSAHTTPTRTAAGSRCTPAARCAHRTPCSRGRQVQ